MATASPGSHGPIAAPASASRGPAARRIAPSTPPPPSRDSLAAVTMASTSCMVMSPSTTSIAPWPENAIAVGAREVMYAHGGHVKVALLGSPRLSRRVLIAGTRPVTERVRVREPDDDDR